MEVIHIDLPIFYDPAGAFGYFSGVIEVSHLPHSDEPFPWPQPWLSNHEALFREQSKQVWGITPWEWPPTKHHVTMFGIVCSSREEAGLLSKHIERVSGILFSEHNAAAEPGDA